MAARAFGDYFEFGKAPRGSVAHYAGIAEFCQWPESFDKPEEGCDS